jgi:hypothetical protein
MISTITNYANNINTLFPVTGQDNDSQGFRDNFANIKQALRNASNEINTLVLNKSQIVQKTVIVQGTNGGLQGTAVGLSSATIRLHQNELDPARSSPVMSITGTCHVAVSCDKVGNAIQLTGTHGGNTWPYDNWFTVNRPDLVKLGSTFKFYNADSVTYTVTNVKDSTVYVNSSFDPVELQSNGVTTSSVITMFGGKMISSLFRDHTPPRTPLGKPGDEQGAMVVTSSSVHIAHADYDGTSNIWTKLNTNIETNKLSTVGVTSYSENAPNVTCDLSTSTRFYVHLMPNDAGINFVNMPPMPCQIEAFLTIRFNINQPYELKEIYINGIERVPMRQKFPLPTINGSTGTYHQTALEYGYRKYWITLLAVEPNNVNVFLLDSVF